MKLFYVLTVTVILSLAFTGCASIPGTSSKGLEIPIEKAAFKLVTDVKDGGYKIVGTEELKKWIDEGKKLTIISTLTLNDDNVIGILPGAINGVMPKSEKELTQADKDNLLKVAGSDREELIVVYCGFVACRRSHLGAKVLVENGFQNIYRYPGGTTAWAEVGLPLTKQ